MTATKIFGVLSTIFIIGFIVFAFRQGWRERAKTRDAGGPPNGTSR